LKICNDYESLAKELREVFEGQSVKESVKEIFEEMEEGS
jgi:hypothetical protein